MTENTERTVPRETRQRDVFDDRQPTAPIDREQPVAPVGSVTERHRGFRWTPRLVIWTILLTLVLIFVLQNFNDIRVDILFWDYTPPLALIVGIFFLVGYVLGWLRPSFRGHRRS